MQNLCQSCGVPIDKNKIKFGTEKNGLDSSFFCEFCYSKGKFNHNVDMVGMIDVLLPMMQKYDKGITKEDARTMLTSFLPTLERWKKREDFCQSCGMPLANIYEKYGTEKNGLKSSDFCNFCYKNGEFTHKVDLDGMVEIIVPFMLNYDADMNEEQTKQVLKEFLPSLKRWR